MNSIRVVLALDPPLYRDVWRKFLETEPAIQIVGDGSINPVDILLTVRETGADVVVCAWNGAKRMPAVCTHLLQEQPRLLVIGISSGADCCATAWRHTVSTTSLGSPDEVMASIRQNSIRASMSSLLGTPLSRR